MTCFGIQHSHAARSIVSTGNNVARNMGPSAGDNISVRDRDLPAVEMATDVNTNVLSVSSSVLEHPVTVNP